MGDRMSHYGNKFGLIFMAWMHWGTANWRSFSCARQKVVGTRTNLQIQTVTPHIKKKCCRTCHSVLPRYNSIWLCIQKRRECFPWGCWGAEAPHQPSSQYACRGKLHHQISFVMWNQGHELRQAYTYYKELQKFWPFLKFWEVWHLKLHQKSSL